MALRRFPGEYTLPTPRYTFLVRARSVLSRLRSLRLVSSRFTVVERNRTARRAGSPRVFLNSARASPSARTRAIHFDTSSPQRFFDSTGTYCERRTGDLYADRRCRSKFSEIDGEIRSPWLRPRSLDPEPSRMDARLRVQLRVRRIRIECARNCNIMVEIRIFFRTVSRTCIRSINKRQEIWGGEDEREKTRGDLVPYAGRSINYRTL